MAGRRAGSRSVQTSLSPRQGIVNILGSLELVPLRQLHTHPRSDTGRTIKSSVNGKKPHSYVMKHGGVQWPKKYQTLIPTLSTPRQLTLTYQQLNYSNNYVHDWIWSPEHHTKARITVICSKHTKYQLHLWQVISKSLFHSFRGPMLDDYLEHYKSNSKRWHWKSWTRTINESIWKFL